MGDTRDVTDQKKKRYMELRRRWVAQAIKIYIGMRLAMVGENAITQRPICAYTTNLFIGVAMNARQGSAIHYVYIFFQNKIKQSK